MVDTEISKKYLKKIGVNIKEFYTALNDHLEKTGEIYSTNSEKLYFLAGFEAGMRHEQEKKIKAYALVQELRSIGYDVD